MPIKAVLFDMFDTLMLIRKNNDFYSPSLMRTYKFLNSKGVNVSFEVFQEAYVKVRDELYAEADKTLGEPHFNERIAKTLQSLGYNHEVSSPLVTEATAEFCSEFLTFVSPDSQAESVLQSLHRKYKLGIVSNFAIPECVDELLEKYNMKGLFDVVVVSAAVNKRKPSPEIFKAAFRALGVSASETVVVGDTLDADVEGAKSVGAKSIYIQRRIEKEAKRVHPDVTIKSLGELLLALDDL
jgi:putative hydrolase of the HAD superfamily